VAAATALLFAGRSGSRIVMPQVYQVKLVAAPAGERAFGVVEPAKAAPAKPSPPRARQAPPQASTKRAPAPRTARATATPTKPTTAASRTPDQAKAGGGPEGGKGTDVANVDLEGLVFPFPGYLQNIVNQIAVRFTWKGPQTYRADVQFFIRRDGSVVGIRVLPTSKAGYEFRQEAAGAIEAAGKTGAFGPLPEGFADEVLPVVFSFDPRIIR
jgi:hypothetical protein